MKVIIVAGKDYPGIAATIKFCVFRDRKNCFHATFKIVVFNKLAISSYWGGSIRRF